MENRYLELLSPAKDLETGRAAINHGADAVYIGGSQFGARQAAGNSISDIEELVRYAHLYRCKIYATVNTLLYDNELEQAQELIRQLYEVGVDALIVQDMGLLELDLPPIALHASTQTHLVDRERIKFFEQVGFERVVLARETSIEEMQAIREATQVELEAFIHGALCVSYSGQCYMSQYLNNRSGNRGACSQPCRSAYDLYNSDGELLVENKHLLSLKDFSAAGHLDALIRAGICSFKIEGRLKDISYVKNTTGYYRQLLDNYMENNTFYKPLSSGRTRLFFVPDTEKTFNRGYTDYFLTGRKKMASLDTQKSLGKEVGEMKTAKENWIAIRSREPINNGDGLCYFDERRNLIGFSVNGVNGNQILPNKPVSIERWTKVWRNQDADFERQLKGESAERKIAVELTLEEKTGGLLLSATDEDGFEERTEYLCDKELATNRARSEAIVVQQLRKSGNTPFRIDKISIEWEMPLFVTASQLNEMRRTVLSRLALRRVREYGRNEVTIRATEIKYPQKRLDYKYNVINRMSERFYKRHGVEEVEWGLEDTHDYTNKALMTTRYCLRFELGKCIKKRVQGVVADGWDKELYLVNNGENFRVEFHCNRCEMCIIASSKTPNRQ